MEVVGELGEEDRTVEEHLVEVEGRLRGEGVEEAVGKWRREKEGGVEKVQKLREEGNSLYRGKELDKAVAKYRSYLE